MEFQLSVSPHADSNSSDSVDSNLTTSSLNDTELKVGSVVSIHKGLLRERFQSIVNESLLHSDPNKKQLLPTVTLFDKTGVEIWSNIIELPTYYQAHDEIRLLEVYGAEIAHNILDGCALIDIGCG
jgi:Histidine-specific methyltransferase, SAM-dependent